MEKINDYLHQQKQDSAYKFTCAMTEFLAATTKERLYRHSREYNWKISNLPHTNMKKVVVIKNQNPIFQNYGLAVHIHDTEMLLKHI